MRGGGVVGWREGREASGFFWAVFLDSRNAEVQFPGLSRGTHPFYLLN